jgi:alkanesulfonate monooxygenase SsuD/methylene tetrahydromethanopterin reductase-like flavin-dependent oxidoreductase (luciferase family)
MRIDGVACGVFLPQVGLDFPALSERAVACEEAGFHSLWLADHFWARGMPDLDYLESWTALTALAMRTTRLRLGTLVLCNSYRNPRWSRRWPHARSHLRRTPRARDRRRLDGRGVPRLRLHFPSTRSASRSWRKALEVMRRLFAESRSTFQGKYYALDDAPTIPKPVQTPARPSRSAAPESNSS